MQVKIQRVSVWHIVWAVALLATIVSWVIPLPLQITSRNRNAGDGQRTVSSAPAALQLSELRGRPLFEPGRRFPAIPKLVSPTSELLRLRSSPVIATRPIGANMVLRGVVIGPDIRGALIAEGGAGAAAFWKQGDQVGKWTLAEVSPTKVVLRQGNDSVELVLPVTRTRAEQGSGSFAGRTYSVSPPLQDPGIR